MATKQRTVNGPRVRALEKAVKALKDYHTMCPRDSFMRFNAWQALGDLRDALRDEMEGFID